jgi:hypothetical protein
VTITVTKFKDVADGTRPGQFMIGEIADSSRFSGTFRPGDPRLIFGLHGPGR